MTTISLWHSTLTFYRPVAVFMSSLASIVFQKTNALVGRQRHMSPQNYCDFMCKLTNDVLRALRVLSAEEMHELVAFLRTDQPLVSTESIEQDVDRVIDGLRREFHRHRAVGVLRAAQLRDEDILKGVLKASAECERGLEEHDFPLIKQHAELKHRLFCFLVDKNAELFRTRSEQFPAVLSN